STTSSSAMCGSASGASSTHSARLASATSAAARSAPSSSGATLVNFREFGLWANGLAPECPNEQKERQDDGLGVRGGSVNSFEKRAIAAGPRRDGRTFL